MNYRRPVTGFSFVEVLAAAMVFAVLVSAAVRLAIGVAALAAGAAEARVQTQHRAEIRALLGPALDGVLWSPVEVGSGRENGPLAALPTLPTGSAEWRFTVDADGISQLQPETASSRDRGNGVCLADREVRLRFDRTQQTLSLIAFAYRRDGALVACLGGGDEGLERLEGYTWAGVSEAVLVRPEADLPLLQFWFVIGGEWQMLAAGEVQVL